MIQDGNLFANIDANARTEHFQDLISWRGARIERIVSTGQATPVGEWLEQAHDEWVLLATGAAGLRFANEPQDRILTPGDWILIPAGARHRVEWTGPEPTVWLAVHIG